ncbi:MAG: hypothetical protein ACTHN5_09875 [Phycisphaerae bacterium]
MILPCISAMLVKGSSKVSVGSRVSLGRCQNHLPRKVRREDWMLRRVLARRRLGRGCPS